MPQFAHLPAEIGKALQASAQDGHTGRNREERDDKVGEVGTRAATAIAGRITQPKKRTCFQSKSAKWENGGKPRAASTKLSARIDGTWIASATKINLAASSAFQRCGCVIQKCRSPTRGSSSTARAVR